MKSNMLCAMVAMFALSGSAAGGDKIPAVYTVPHELDCLVKAGHIQGACCTEKGVYLSHKNGICMIGWDGKLIRQIEVPAHLGDTAYADGKIYGAFDVVAKAMRKNGKRGLVRVWDENLNQLNENWYDDALDGIVVLGDTVYTGVNKWGNPKRHDLCCVKRLKLDLTDCGNTDMDLGYKIAYGVQTMATDGKGLFFGNYGGTSRVSPSLDSSEKVSFRCAEGFGLVPRSISKRETPVFFRVCALGGNMQGWRKDPENNPPRIKLDFWEYVDGKFKDITAADPSKEKPTIR